MGARKGKCAVKVISFGKDIPEIRGTELLSSLPTIHFLLETTYVQIKNIGQISSVAARSLQMYIIFKYALEKSLNLCLYPNPLRITSELSRHCHCL